VSLAVDPGQEPRQRHRVAPVRVASAFDFGGVLAGLEQRYRIVATHRLAACIADQPAQRIRGRGAVERNRCAVLRQRRELGRQRVWFGDIGGLLQMIACAVGELAMIDEHRGAAGLRHQRVG
jgi:hypothetical protein